ncbi:MAG: ThuA domain-containing protein [Acidobacteriota bacterium]
MTRNQIRGLQAVVVVALATWSLTSPPASAAPVTQAPQPAAQRKKLLALGDTRTGFTHDSIGHALATIDRLGRDSGLYDTYIRTDSQWITKSAVPPPARNARNLNDFDAVFLFISGEGDWTDAQKRDFVSFVKDDGKGVVAAHTGNAAFYGWPEFGEMLGGYFDNHPWNVTDAKVVNEAPDFPATRHFPAAFMAKEEFYELRAQPYSRDKVRVLARLDAASVDLKNPDVHRTDRDFPVAMARNYGKGRTFWSTFGHTSETWDDPGVQKMYLEAIKWAMGLTAGDATPRPAPAVR